MHSTLDLAGLPSGAGELVLPLASVKAHLQVLDSDSDDLIEALRDVALMQVEEFTGLRLTARTGLKWRGEAFPASAHQVLRLFARPVTAVTAISYRDADNVAQTFDVAKVRIADGDALVPVPGESWPSDCAGAIEITFTAGLATLADIPTPLKSAMQMLVGTLFKYRESVVTEGATVVLPHGFAMLCGPWRRVRV